MLKLKCSSFELNVTKIEKLGIMYTDLIFRKREINIIW